MRFLILIVFFPVLIKAQSSDASVTSNQNLQNLVLDDYTFPPCPSKIWDQNIDSIAVFSYDPEDSANTRELTGAFKHIDKNIYLEYVQFGELKRGKLKTWFESDSLYYNCTIGEESERFTVKHDTLNRIIQTTENRGFGGIMECTYKYVGDSKLPILKTEILTINGTSLEINTTKYFYNSNKLERLEIKQNNRVNSGSLDYDKDVMVDNTERTIIKINKLGVVYRIESYDDDGMCTLVQDVKYHARTK